MAAQFTIQHHWTAQSARSIGALLLREISSSYGKTSGGYAWAVLEPVAGIALLTFLFSLAFSAPPLGQNFAIFYATGILPFTMYTQVYVKLMVAIWYSKPLLQYPVITFMDALISRFVLTLLTQILVFSLVFAGVLWIYAPQVSLDFGLISLAIAMTAVLGAGIGVLNCLLISVMPSWQRLWNIAHKPMFIISSIFYVFEAVPEPYRSILWYNPLIHIIGLLREGTFANYDAHYASPAYVFALGLVCLVVGLFFLRRWHKDFLYL